MHVVAGEYKVTNPGVYIPACHGSKGFALDTITVFCISRTQPPVVVLFLVGQYEIEDLVRVVVSKPRNVFGGLPDDFAEHRAVYHQIMHVLMAENHEFTVYEHRPGREKELPRQPGDGPRYVYHAVTPNPGDYCLKRGPLPYLWHMEADGYSGWCTLAQDTALQKQSLAFDPAAARRILDDFRNRLQSDSFALIPQPDAQLEPAVAALDDYVFYPLQVNNDAVLELAHCPQFALIRQAGAAAERLRRHLVLKRHPLCTSDTVAAAIAEVINSDYVHLSTGPTTDLIAKARAVMLTNSSVGVQALILDVPVFTFGRSEYAHLTTQLRQPEETLRVFEDHPPRPHDAYAGGIAYLLSDYLVDMRNPAQIAARITAHIADCQALPQAAENAPLTGSSQADLVQMTLERALSREATEQLDFVLMTYPDLQGAAKTRVAQMLSRLARTGMATERIIQNTDADVSNRCLRYLEQNEQTDLVLAVARARIAVAPDDWRAHAACARALRAKGDAEAALDAARLAAQCPDAPASQRLFYVRSRWSTQGRPDQTIRDLVADVLDADPRDAIANWLQARLCLEDGDPAAAQRYIAISLAAEPDDTRFRSLSAKISKTKT